MARRKSTSHRYDHDIDAEHPCQFFQGGIEYDIDYNSWQEGKNGIAGKATFAAITSRSHHVGLVHAAFLDGSVTSISDSIELKVWRAMGTRANHEVVQRN